VKAFRLESQLIYSNRQIHAEFTTLLYTHIHALRLTSDFLTTLPLALSPCASILRSLHSRPWLSKIANIRTVRLVVRVHPDVHDTATFWSNPEIYRKYPALMTRLRKAELALKEKMDRTEEPFWPIIPPRPRRGTPVSHAQYAASISQPVFEPKSMLPELVKVFENFPALERVEIEPDVPGVLMLYPDPFESLRCLEALSKKGVEVCLVLREWERWLFFAILELLGMKKDEVEGVKLWDYENRRVGYSHYFPSGVDGRGGTLRYRVLDWVPRAKEKEGEEAIGSAMC
jgi:hypothetical protein